MRSHPFGISTQECLVAGFSQRLRGLEYVMSAKWAMLSKRVTESNIEERD